MSLADRVSEVSAPSNTPSSSEEWIGVTVFLVCLLLGWARRSGVETETWWDIIGAGLGLGDFEILCEARVALGAPTTAADNVEKLVVVVGFFPLEENGWPPEVEEDCE